MPPLADPADEANRILVMAETKHVVLRLLGGMSFYFQCPSAKHRTLQRNYVDIDLMGRSKQSKEIRQLFVELGYVGRDRFNAMQGDRRLIFNDMDNHRRVDIFLDTFQMCHTFNFKDRLEIDSRTLPLADMLATKLQVVEINDKDMKDILSLILDHDVGEKDTGVNGAYLAKLCGENWGVYKTFTTNLEKAMTAVPQLDFSSSEKEMLLERLQRLKRMIEESPKSLRWRMRATVGEKVQWYLLPEADKAVVDSRLEAKSTQAN